MTIPTMTDTAIEADGLEPVEFWRVTQLLDAGIDPELAGEIAAAEDMDYRDAVRLHAAGCPDGLLRRILF